MLYFNSTNGFTYYKGGIILLKNPKRNLVKNLDGISLLAVKF